MCVYVRRVAKYNGNGRFGMADALDFAPIYNFKGMVEPEEKSTCDDLCQLQIALV